MILNRLSVTVKIGLAIFALLGVALAGFAMNIATKETLSGHAIQLGREDAPMVDAAMEIKLTATHAHLLFEEIMSGDEGESIDEVWALIDDARFYATALLEGGTNEEGTFAPARDPEIRAIMQDVLSEIERFESAARERYATLQGDQGVGSGADEEFDALYDELVSDIANLAQAPTLATNAPMQAAAGEARFGLAHGHLLVAEILGGDAGEDFSEASESFVAARDALQRLAGNTANRAEVTRLQAGIDQLISLAETRYEVANSVSSAGSGADVEFDATFDAFIAKADEAESLAQDGIAASLVSLEAEAARSKQMTYASIAALLLIFLASGWMVQHLIAKRLRDLAATADALAEGNLDASLPTWEASDELGKLRNTLANFKQGMAQQHEMAERLRVEEENRAVEQKKLLADAARTFYESTHAKLEAMQNAASQLAESVNGLQNDAETTHTLSGETSGATQRASSNVQTVASAAEELDASIAEIASQVSSSSQIVGKATETMQVTEAKVTELSDAAKKIGDVVKLISDIAEQTNLLALNATIEAARAGAAGKGFAVVAAEVKDLATQTAKATGEISEQIAAIQFSTDETAQAITEISQTMQEVNSYASSIASSVEQQGAATREISSSAQEASARTSEVASSMDKMEAAMERTRTTTAGVGEISASISASVGDLSAQVDELVRKFEAA